LNEKPLKENLNGAITRRAFLESTTLTGAGVMLGATARGELVQGSPARKPNIVYVFADQLRADIVGCYGGDQITTPHMDRMAAEGCKLTNCISTYPVCSPYRGMLMTGRYPMNNGTVANDTPVRDDLPSIAKVLKENGYATGYIGKWHLESHREPFVPHERRQGFDYWAVRNCNHNHFDSFYCGDTPEEIPLPGWEPEQQTKLAVDYFRKHQEEPFCLFVSWGPPHNPYIAPERYNALYPKEFLRFRENVYNRDYVDALLASDPTDNPSILQSRESVRAILDDDDRLLEWWQGYLAMTKSLDDYIGIMLEELETLGIADDTIFIFTSDHGDMLGSHRMGSKQMPYEESIRVPWLLRYPRGVAEGVVSDALLSPVDIMPTLLGMAGIPIPDSVDGLDFQEAMRGERHDQRDAVLLMKMLPGGNPWIMNGVREWRGVRSKQYTYARLMEEDGPWCLFDNLADPLQLNNLVQDASFQSLCQRMEKRMTELMADANDPGVTEPIQALHLQRRAEV